QNCKACGKICPDTADCVAGKCKCQPGDTLCGDQCVDTDVDEAHCGACDQTCIGGTCDGGECVCPDGETNCGGTCANLDQDPKHCGSCDVACTDAEVCGVPDSGAGGGGGAPAGGVHECVCPPDREDCSGVCADLQTDHDHCGDCDTAC